MEKVKWILPKFMFVWWKGKNVTHVFRINLLLLNNFTWDLKKKERKKCTSNVSPLTFRGGGRLLGKESIDFALLTAIIVYRQAGLDFPMHFLRNRSWNFVIICGCMFGSVMNSISIAQTRGAPILYLACFLLAGLLCCCLQSRQALRLGWVKKKKFILLSKKLRSYYFIIMKRYIQKYKFKNRLEV